MDIIPFTVKEGKVIAIKIGDEVLETPQIPIESLNKIGDTAAEYLNARKEFEAFRQSFVLIEKRFLNTKEKLEIALQEASGAGKAVERPMIIHIEEPYVSQKKHEEPVIQYEPEKKEEKDVASIEQAHIEAEEFAKQELLKKEPVEKTPEKPIVVSEAQDGSLIKQKEKLKVTKPPAELAREIYLDVVKALKEKVIKTKGKGRGFNEAELHVQLSSMGVPDEQVKLIAEMIINELLETKPPIAYKKHKLLFFKKEIVLKEEDKKGESK